MESRFFNELIDLMEQKRNSELADRLVQYINKQGVNMSEYVPVFARLITKAVEYQESLEPFEHYRSLVSSFQYVDERYTRFCHASNDYTPAAPSTVWCCWLQGIENAPPLVKACVSSLSSLGLPVKIITAENLNDYITLPDFVIDKWKAGIISHTHFSDFIRLALLTEYGGIWADATILITDKNNIPCIDTDGFFSFKNILRGFESNFFVFSGWFMISPPNHPLLTDTRDMLYAYWENESELINFFLIDHLFNISSKVHSNLWNEIPVYSTLPPEMLMQELFLPYTKERWDRLTSLSGVHKLSYKRSRPDTSEYLIIDHILDTYKPLQTLLIKT